MNKTLSNYEILWNVQAGDVIQIAGGYFEGKRFDGFEAIVSHQSHFIQSEERIECNFFSVMMHGVAYFNPELKMWDIVEEDCELIK